MEIVKDPETQEILWPPEVLKQARQSVVDSKYAPGAEETILRGECDHWHAIQVACHAITGFVDQPPKEAIEEIDINDRALDMKSRIALLERKLQEDMEQRNRDIAERIRHTHRTLDAKRKNFRWQ